jgi:4-alpha-glucanotransferase
MQDLLGLGSEHRLNTPGTVDNNWSWRFEWDWIEQALIDRMRVMNGIYGRSGVDENHG